MNSRKNNIYTIFKPIFRISRIFGISPYLLEMNNFDPKIDKIYSILRFILFSICVTFHLTFQKQKKMFQLDVIYYSETFVIITGVLSVYILMIYGLKNRKLIKYIINELYKIDNIIRITFGKCMDYTKIKAMLMANLYFSLLSIFGVLNFYYYFSVHNFKTFTYLNVFYTVTNITSLMCIFVCTFEFIVFVQISKNLLQTINGILEELKNSNTKCICLFEFKTVTQLHLRLIDVLKLVNEGYSVQLFFKIVGSCLMIFIAVMAIFLRFVYKICIYDQATEVIWILFNSFDFVMLCYFCEGTIYEVKKLI